MQITLGRTEQDWTGRKKVLSSKTREPSVWSLNSCLSIEDAKTDSRGEWFLGSSLTLHIGHT